MFLAQANPSEDMFNDIHPRYERWLQMFGFTDNYLVRAIGVRDAGEVKNRPEVLEQAKKLARELVG
jgi:hypothetical protein